MKAADALRLGSLALAVLAPSCAQAAGDTPIEVVKPGVTPMGALELPPGAPAHMAIELTDAPPTEVEGEMSRGYVIAHHTVRVVDARVLLEPARAADRDVPAGTVLAKVAPQDGSQAGVWCDLGGRFNGLRKNLHICFSETEPGSGRFDHSWIGQSSSDFLGLDPGAVREMTPLPAPIRYRAATPEERPTGLLGYRWCDGDGVNGPPRFMVVATLPGQAWSWGGPRGCAFGVWPDPSDHSRVDLDGVSLTVQPGTRRDTLRFKFDGRIAAAPVLADLEVGRPVRAAGAPAAPDPNRPSATERTLVPAGELKLTAGDLAKGQAFASLKVRHGVTGVLRNEVREYYAMPFPRGRLAVGQPVFGVVVSSPAGPQVAWCAPRVSAKTICLVDDGYAYEWLDVAPVMMPAILMVMNIPSASPPTVERRPVDLPVMTLSYAFAGVDRRQNALRMVQQIDWGEGAQTVKQFSLILNADGVATWTTPGGNIVFRTVAGTAGGDGDRIRVEITGTPSAAALAR